MKFVPLAAKINAQKNISGCPVPPNMIQADQIFVMSPSVALEIEKLSHDPKFFVHPRDLHLPYRSIYVETPLTLEVKAMRREIGEKAIVRVGAHISEISGGGAFTFWPSWEFDDGSVGFGMVVAIVNPPKEMVHTSLYFRANDENAAVNLSFIPAPPLISMALSSGRTPEAFIQHFSDLMAQNPSMASEVIEEISPLLMAWTTLVNCKTGITKTHIKRVKPKAAGKRSAILNGTSYTVVTLSAVESVSEDGAVSTRTDLSAHYVRGHFKRRATGMFWWQPFIRGTGAVEKREAYFVRDTTEESVPA